MKHIANTPIPAPESPVVTSEYQDRATALTRDIDAVLERLR